MAGKKSGGNKKSSDNKENKNRKEVETAAASKPGGTKMPVVVAIVSIALIGAMLGGYSYMAGKDAEKKINIINSYVGELENIVHRERMALMDFQEGLIIMQATDQLLMKTQEDIERILSNIEKVVYMKPLFGGSSKVETVKQNAENVCRVASSMTFSYLTGVQFRAFRRKIEEGVANDENGNQFAREYDRLLARFHEGKSEPGLEKAPGAPPSDAQYVFLILVDTLRADHLKTYGYGRDTSPNIDKLASEGILFENAISQCSTTDTSVASLMTGLYPKTHKMMGGSDWLWENMLVDNLRKAGYTTGGFSANSLISRDFHYDNGFDYFEEVFWGRSTVLFSETQRWLEKTYGDNKKIFAYIHLIDPHDMYFAPGQFFDYFNRGTTLKMTSYGLSKLIEEEYKKLGDKYPECRFDPNTENLDKPEILARCISHVEHMGAFTMNDVTSMVDRYDGEIRYTDAEIGRFINYLEKKGILSKSLIVVMSDHGESFMEHNQIKHGRNVYDNEIHVPLIIWRGGGRLSPKRISEPVELIDVMPTIFAQIGVETPPGIDGRNLLGEAPDKPDPTFSVSWNSLDYMKNIPLYMETIRQPPYKYIRVMKRGSDEFYRDMFFDIGADPKEMIDARDKAPAEFAGMKEKIEQWDKYTDRVPARKLNDKAGGAKTKRLKDLGYVR